MTTLIVKGQIFNCFEPKLLVAIVFLHVTFNVTFWAATTTTIATATTTARVIVLFIFCRLFYCLFSPQWAHFLCVTVVYILANFNKNRFALKLKFLMGHSNNTWRFFGTLRTHTHATFYFRKVNPHALGLVGYVVNLNMGAHTFVSTDRLKSRLYKWDININ